MLYDWLDEHLLNMNNVVRDFDPKKMAYRYFLNKHLFAYLGFDRSNRPVFSIELPPELKMCLKWDFNAAKPCVYRNCGNWLSLYFGQDISPECMIRIIDYSYSSLSNEDSLDGISENIKKYSKLNCLGRTVNLLNGVKST